MARRDWEVKGGPLGIFLNGDAIRSVSDQDEPIRDDSLLLLFNAHHEQVEFVLPARRFGRRWEVALSTAEPDGPAHEHPARATVPVESRSIVVLRRVR
jgi:glycogen operon protein